MTAVGFLVERFESWGATPAVIAPAGRCDFGELAAAVERWGARLDREAIRAGTVTILEGDFTPATAGLFLALAERRAIVVPEGRTSDAGRDERARIARAEVRCRVGEHDEVTFERVGNGAAHELYDALRGSGRPGLVQFSSGTSGQPKAAVHDLAALLEKFHVRRPALTTLAFLPFDHLGGLNTMLHALSNGGTLVATDDRSPESICRLIDAHRVELLPATPTFFNLLLLSGARRHHDLGSLRVISYGAEPMPPNTLARLRAAFPGVRLQQTYGLTEVGALRTKSRDDGSLWVRVGGEGYETRVVDGMLQLRARSMLLGYLNAPTPLTEDGWLITGDRVEQDGDYLRFLGRDSDLINVGGEKVHPTEIEAVIESMDGVRHAVVHGEPNGIAGTIVCATVSPTGPCDERQLAADVKRFCRRRLARFKVPVKVRVTAEPELDDRHKKRRTASASRRP